MDKAGVAFAVLIIILAVAVAVVLVRTWESLQGERFFGVVFVVSTIFLGLVSIARDTGRLDDGPAYQTLNISLSALSTVTLLFVFIAEWRRRRKGSSGVTT